MSKTVKEISVVIGQYTNAQGEEKKRYQRIGSIIQTRNGDMLKIDCIPLREGGWDGWAYMNDPRPKDYAEKPQTAQRSPAPDYEDDIPF